jgi:flagellar hook-associated protein 3 FlgL
MLTLMERHTSNISTQDTNLGSRIVRLELINERLLSDRINYTDLMSDNEDVDYFEVVMRLSAAEAVYAASLKAGASIIQLSLADFLR